MSFNGNTGPYLQYMGARINSILGKAADAGLKEDDSDEAVALLTGEDEWALIRQLGNYPEVIAKAAEGLNPSEVAAYVYETAKLFSNTGLFCTAAIGVLAVMLLISWFISVKIYEAKEA